MAHPVRFNETEDLALRYVTFAVTCHTSSGKSDFCSIRKCVIVALLDGSVIQVRVVFRLEQSEDN